VSAYQFVFPWQKPVLAVLLRSFRLKSPETWPPKPTFSNAYPRPVDVPLCLGLLTEARPLSRLLRQEASCQQG
jgi:hypothetical protein